MNGASVREASRLGEVSVADEVKNLRSAVYVIKWKESTQQTSSVSGLIWAVRLQNGFCFDVPQHLFMSH